MIVFGVCTLGVAGLYLVPSVAGSPSPVAMPHIADEPTPEPAGHATVKVPQAGATGFGEPDDVAVTKAAEPADVAPAEEPEPTEDAPRPTVRPTERARTAFDPDDAPDSEPPAAVPTISPDKVTAHELTVTWPAATDNRRVIGYRIWLNGYEVATTAETRATLRWFNDDEGQHVVQIKAIDAAGNQSDTWSTLLVTRPSAEPTRTPQPTPAPTDTPTASPEPGESASLAPKSQPSPSITSTTKGPHPEPTATDQ
jgi:hypothetical protein